MGPRTGLDRCRKSRPPPGFDPRTVQPVAIRYTDYTTRPTSGTVVTLKTRNILQFLPLDALFTYMQCINLQLRYTFGLYGVL